MVNTDILGVHNFLKAKGIIIPPENQWFQACVSCFKENSNSCDFRALSEFVFEQWLLADLSDVCAPSIPNICDSSEKISISGKHAVQINYVVNVAEPFYKQIQKVRSPQADINLSVDSEKEKNQMEPSTHRTLKFEFSDGLTVIKGFEDKPILTLPETIVPGVKVILNGPIVCRKGVLFLREGNIIFLGGEVDTLHVPNAVENILARSLGLPENPDPYNLQKPLPKLKEELLDEDDALFRLAADIDGKVIKKECLTQIQPGFVSDLLKSEPKSLKEIIVKEEHIIISDEDDDFAMIAAETASVAEKKIYNAKQTNLTNFFTKSQTSGNDRVASCTSHLEQRRLEDLRATLEDSYANFKKEDNKIESVENNVFLPSRQFNLDLPRSHNEEGKVMIDSTKSLFLNDIVNEPEEPECSSNIKKSKAKSINDSFPPTSFPSTQILKGSVVTLSQKLGLRNDKWTLSAILSVKGKEIEVDFSSDALDKVFGMTASELQARRHEVRQNPEIKEKINDILKKSQQRIKRLNCKMSIHFSSYIAKPVILDIFDS